LKASLLDKLERHFRRFAIPRLTLVIVIGQVMLYILSRANPERMDRFTLNATLVMKGEWWRLITFMFFPPVTNVLFAFFALYIFYLFGSSLEARWGEFRYNVYILIAYLATVLVAFILPGRDATNVFIGGSVFLAFAYLYPEFTLRLFFVLPIKIKYLAWITWFGYIYTFVFGTRMSRLLVLASVANFLLFFGRSIVIRGRNAKRRMEASTIRRQRERMPFHRCRVCGKTEKSDPDMDFRVCPECDGGPDYCADHIFDHEHIRKSS